MSIGEKIKTLAFEIPSGVRLVAVSKFHPAEAILEAYDSGQRLFGESRVQELLAKIPVLPSDIKWHFIGHLQTNKVHQIIGKISLIESVDSVRLLEVIEKESSKASVLTDILLQVHVAQEDTKFGFSPDEYLSFFEDRIYKKFRSVRIRGIMGMASNTDDVNRIRKDFQKIFDLYKYVKNNKSDDFDDFDIISMGMSGDWKIAVEEGSNMIRIGSFIFGERNY